MLAMFQIPNKFYERDGRITDANGQDWESFWGELIRPRLKPSDVRVFSARVLEAANADVAKR